MKRSLWSLWSFSAIGCIISFLIAGCGKNYYFAGRALPPSGILNRVLIAIQNPNIGGQGALAIVDAYYDIRHSFNNKVPNFSISGYGQADPQTIQNMPEEQSGAVYGFGDGSFVTINYAGEKQNMPINGLPGPSTSIFISRDQRYVFAANQSAQFLTVIDRSGGGYYLSLPNVFRVSINPSGSVALAFVQNSNQVYSVLRLQSNERAPANAVDCEPQNLPVYCVMPVAGTFDRPTKAVFSPDGNTAYVLNCGQECGGVQASVSYLPTAGVLIQSGAPVPPGTNTGVTATVPVPGGATDAIASGNTLYLAGQQLQPDGYFAGMLSVLDTVGQQVTGTYPISDGTHNKMIFGDDNTLWIGSKICSQGERFHQQQSGASLQIGCLTMFNTSTNSVTAIDAYKGDATGIAAVTGLHKVYTAEGGQVYIYRTTDGSSIDNSNVAVVGTAADVAYMDAPTDDDNTYY